MSDRITKLGDFQQFYGDTHPHTFVISNVSAFTAVTQKIVRKGQDTDLSPTYATGSASYSGNSLTSASFGFLSSVNAPAGVYRVFLTGTYDGGHVHTWCVEVEIFNKK